MATTMELDGQRGGFAALRVLHYVYPLSIFVYYAFASLISVCMTREEPPKSKSKSAPRKNNVLHRTIHGVMLGILGAQIIEVVILLVANFNGDTPSPSRDTIVGSILASLAWAVLVAGFIDAPTPAQLSFTGSWILATTMEVCIVGLTAAFDNQGGRIRYTRLMLGLIRLCGLVVLTGLACLFVWLRKSSELTSEEAQPLLGGPGNAVNGAKDGQVNGAAEHASTHQSQTNSSDGDDDEEDDRTALDRLPKGNWWSYAKKFSMLLPILWPAGHKTHQLRILGCGLCLLAIRALNLLTPRQTGIAIDTLTKSAQKVPLDDTSSWLWIEPILLLALYGWLNSGAGFPFLQSYLWVPVENHNLQKLHTWTYNHIMELSSDFHDSKRSGRLWHSMWQGYSVTSVLQLVLFEVVPVLFDFALAAIYIYFVLDPYLALIVFGTSILYLWSTTAMVSRMNTLRRSVREANKTEYGIMTESMSNWRTVSYFNRIAYEESRYAAAARDSKKKTLVVALWIRIERALKASIMQLGLFLMLVVSGYRVVRSGAPVGDVVVLLQLWNQISQPLRVISESFTRIASDLVAAEDLIKVLQKKSSIQDDKAAKQLDLQQGEVEFESVNFSYDKKRMVLKDVSFRVLPGQTVALVGETGGGKSTILKLLFRFYDVISGSVKIDGQDIRKVTVTSLRDSIGNVPQDATLFNDTILNNVKYAKLDATDEEVIEACKAAHIHDKIMTFTKRYESKVGEGGTKLSGGELQRIAIARTILQNPPIVLLDEATSSVDTETEGHIQESLKQLTSGRTTFVIAHRLSTIVNADFILVVRNGEIAEQGTHLDLMKMQKQYHNLWTKQMFPDIFAKGKKGREGSIGVGGLGYINDLPDSEISKLKQSTEDLDGDQSTPNDSNKGEDSTRACTSGLLDTENSDQMEDDEVKKKSTEA